MHLHLHLSQAGRRKGHGFNNNNNNNLVKFFFFYSSCWTKGLAISSLPSTGEMSTMSVPRATTRPRERVVSLPASSAALRLEGIINKEVTKRAYPA